MSGPVRFFVAVIGAGIMMILLSSFGLGTGWCLALAALGLFALFGALPAKAAPGATPATPPAKPKKMTKEERDAYALWGVVTVFMLILMGMTWWFLSASGPVAQYGRAHGNDINRIKQPLLVSHDNPDQATVLRHERVFHPNTVHEIFDLEEGQCWVLGPTTEPIEFRISGDSVGNFETLSPRTKKSRWCATQAGMLQLRVPRAMTLKFDRE